MSALGRLHLVYREKSQSVNRKLIELGLIASVQRSCLFSHSVLRKGMEFAGTAALGFGNLQIRHSFQCTRPEPRTASTPFQGAECAADFPILSGAVAPVAAGHSAVAEDRFVA